MDVAALVIQPDVPIGIGGLPVFLSAVRTLESRFLSTLVSEMCQHIALFTERAAASRTGISLAAFIVFHDPTTSTEH